MAKSLSAVTKLKIARSLKGNKNAFKGGPKARLSTRQKIANINASTKAKKANLSSDQIARRQSVAKRLRAQARREEALGGGVPEVLKTNEQAKAEAGVTRSRASSGSIEKVQERARQVARENNQRREAETAKQRGREASIPRNAKQNLNAPQTPPEQRTAALSPAQRRRQQASKFEADQAKARLAQTTIKAGDTVELNGERRIVKAVRSGGITEFEGGGLHGLGMREGKLKKVEGGASEFARQRGAQVVDVPISGRGSRGGGRRKDPFNSHYDKAEKKVVDRIDDLKREISQMEAHRGSNSLPGPAEKRARNALETARGRLSRLRFERSQNNTPKPPQSDTGTDRSGTFTKKVPVKGEKSTRSNGRKAIETEEDLQDLIAEKTPDIIRKLAKGIPQSDLRDLKAMIGKEMGAEGLDALNDILKG